MPRKFKIGIVGFGKMGMLHGALVNSHDGLEFCAVAEKSYLLGAVLGRTLNKVAVFSDYKKMIRKIPLDAILITTPTFNHYEAAIYAIESGISVFIEKPLTTNYKDAQKLNEAASKAGLRSFVGFCNRYLPTIQKGRALYLSGLLGSVTSVNAGIYSGDILREYYGWRFKPEISGGGALIDFGIHMVDLLKYFFGQVTSVSGCVKHIYSRAVEDEFIGVINFTGGISANFETSWSRQEYRKPSLLLEIVSEKGKMIITDQALEVSIDGNSEILYAPDLYMGDYIDIAGIHYSKQINDFYSSLDLGRNSDNDIESAVYVQKIVDAMYRTCNTGEPIIL